MKPLSFDFCKRLLFLFKNFAKVGPVKWPEAAGGGKHHPSQLLFSSEDYVIVFVKMDLCLRRLGVYLECSNLYKIHLNI